MTGIILALIALACFVYLVKEFVTAIRDPYTKPEDELLPNESNEDRIYR